MSDINNKNAVEKQYASSGNLQTRISIHEKYSTNKMGFGKWIFSHYEISDGARILELGCGTASMWKGQEALIQKCGQLVLSDFSPAMVEAAKETLGWRKDNLGSSSHKLTDKKASSKLDFKIIDIQNIPYEDKSFDLVIANMMLYHVPDLPRALSEVRRVLKPQGKFYSATFGEHGIMEYLAGLLGQFGVEDKTSRNFTLQNREKILKTTFATVEKKIYEDSLAVTDVADLVDYIYSLASMSSLSSQPREAIYEILQSHMVNGVLTVPKEYGIFISYGEKK